MHVITDAQAPRFALPGVEFTAYAAPSRGSAELCAWRLTVDPGLVSDQAHHLDRDEIFMLVSGQLQLSLGGPTYSAGDCVIVPAGTSILLSNPGTEPATAHVLVRAGFTGTMADGTVVGTPPWAQ